MGGPINPTMLTLLVAALCGGVWAVLAICWNLARIHRALVAMEALQRHLARFQAGVETRNELAAFCIGREWYDSERPATPVVLPVRPTGEVR